MKMRTWLFGSLLLAAAALGIIWAAAPTDAMAGSKDPPKMVFNGNFTATDTLTAAHKSKVPVEVTLKNGKVYAGFVGGVGSAAFFMTHLRGKEYYDAWVRTESVVSVEARMRR